MSINYEKAVLRVMLVKRIWGSNHKKVETLIRSGFPVSERGNIKKAIKNLIKQELIQWYSRSRNAIQLNKNKMAEILEKIE